MDIYLTDLTTNRRVGLSWLPEEIVLRGDAGMYEFTSISLGQVEYPAPSKLEELSFQTRLPCAARKSLSFVKAHLWEDPNELIQLFRDWKDKGTKLRLMVTETKINMDVRIFQFEARLIAGPGDWEVNIGFRQARDLTIHTMDEQGSQPGIDQNTRPNPNESNTSGKQYTVKTGDTLWDIARVQLGNALRWQEIYNLNKNKISSNYYVYTGQVLTLP